MASVTPSVQAKTSSVLRLLLVDDHAILREGVRGLLELDPGLTVVGECGSCDEAIALARSTMPDIVLTDIGLPGRSGLSLIADLRNLSPDIRVILLTAHSSDEYIQAAVDVRADGYVLKDSDHAELITAIRTVAKGQPFMCKTVSNAVMANYLGRGSHGEQSSSKSPLRLVTERERQVLSRIASGRTNKAVARELTLSVKTVEKHRANLMRKLDLHNSADITRFALGYGLITRISEEVPAAREIISILLGG
ncbi:MAG: response regulator transcription factor [Pseudomonadota bacterium]